MENTNTYLTVAMLGIAWAVFRVEEGKPLNEQLSVPVGGIQKSKRAANAAAKKIAAQTGEEIR